MVSFIDSVVDSLLEKNFRLNNCVFVLPTRRAAVFLRDSLSERINQPILSPELFSIDVFIEHLCGLRTVTSTELLFQFYTVYTSLTPPKEQQPFEEVMTWAPTVLQDFNELDRFLIDASAVLGYIKAIKDIDHWSLSEKPTALISSHLKFWNRLLDYYTGLQKHLEQQGLAYQGMSYRYAVDDLETYLANTNKHHVFLGFNALNKAESSIIQELLQNDNASIFWDTDEAFHNNLWHSAGIYTRQFKQQWAHYRQQPFNWIGTQYRQPKDITVTGTPKRMGQAQYVGALLQDLLESGADLSQVAVILGDESLALPVINNLPKGIQHVNITMGLPLYQVPTASLFDLLFKIHRTQTKKFYYRDVLALLSHSSIRSVFQPQQLISAIHAQNKVYISLDWINQILEEPEDLTNIMFCSWNNSANEALGYCQKLIDILKFETQTKQHSQQLQLEYLYRFHNLFNSLKDLNGRYQHFDSINGLYKVYRELLNSETLDFRGEPLKGLQIMGMLESRVLDFKTVIITSVNEGVLPAGKTNNSVIPYDVKLQYQLPTYKDKDAVYTHHFYRLLQRAEQVHLIYNTEIDPLRGGEKSRFITQIETEGVHNIKHQIVSPEVIFDPVVLKHIPKTKDIGDKLLQLASYGFSPSALGKYIRNPIDFYYRYVLGLEEQNQVEEHIAANTFGTVLHDTLEQLYTPFIGQELQEPLLKDAKTKSATVVEHYFKTHYGEGNYSSGKNLISFEVAKRYIENFISLEIASLQDGNTIRIIGLEHKAKAPITIEGDYPPIHLKGTVDRIDEFNGELRIIDYKSGRVTAGDVALHDWSELIEEDKKSKAFQLLCYSYIYWKSTGKLPAKAGIISFKNLNSGTLYFGTKASKYAKKVDHNITEDTIHLFINQISVLIKDILNIHLPFEEKEL